MTDDAQPTPVFSEMNGSQDPAAEIAALRAALEEAQTKGLEYLDGWQRARADFTNYKRRIERDQAQTYQNAAGSLLKRFVDVLDDLELALKNRPKDGEGAAFAAGLELIVRKLATGLELEGVSIMDAAAGQPFDPNLHEAVSHEAGVGVESGAIIEVLKRGYLIGERVLRPAQVRVAK